MTAIESSQLGAVTLEICVDSVESAVAAGRGGAQRVELCSDLLEGGITPSAGLIEGVRARVGVGLQVMIRPRGGDFFYTEEEFHVMKRDVVVAKELGADGVVFGILQENGSVDVVRTRELVELAGPLNVTFHRAFDVSADLPRALEDVCAAGVDRILTSGGEPTAEKGAAAISQLVQTSTGRIVILACGGIRAHNAAAILKQTGAREIHAAPRSLVARRSLQRPRVAMGSAPEEQLFQVREEDVRSLRVAVDSCFS